jgi:hypothetical protein
VDSLRHSSPGRLRRLGDELEEEVGSVLTAVTDTGVLLDEVDYALRPPRHERRVPTYGAIVLPTVPVAAWTTVTGLHAEVRPTATRDDHDVRRYADGLASWTLRSNAGVDALVVFDRSAGSERDLVVLAEATGAVLVQRRPDRGVRIVGPFGVARWDESSWHVEPPLGSWLERASSGLTDRETTMLEQLLRFAVHDLGAAGIGALFVFGGGASGLVEERLAPPPPLRLDHPSDLGPLRHVLAQVDGAAFVDSAGILRRLGVRLIPSASAEDAIDALGGTRHTSARRYSADDPDAIVIAVSEAGPVTVFRDGRVIGRSPVDDRT